jgi:intracellular septation protein
MPEERAVNQTIYLNGANANPTGAAMASQTDASSGHGSLAGRLAVPLALEAGPLLAFFLANAVSGIFVATGVLMAATVVSASVSAALKGRLPIAPLVSCVLVLGLGGMTLWVDDATFIKIKPTIVNGLFGAALLADAGLRLGLLQRAFGHIVPLGGPAWRLLAWRAAAFLIALAVLNEIVWRTSSTDAWVAFKVFAILPLDIAFVAAQIPLIRRSRMP